MREPPQGGYRAYVAQVEAARPQWLMWLVHHYLFFQIPLVRPDRFLRATLPFVDWLFSKSIAWIIALIGLAGVYLVSRQWDTFTATVLHFFTPRGLALYALSLAVVKMFHELGHAYTATRYGCRVPTMGIAMVVMVPMLYSDTSDAWKLTSRHQRAAIGAAGMVVECALAALAIFAWNFLDDGVARSLVFIVATTSLMVGAGINLSPFMRWVLCALRFVRYSQLARSSLCLRAVATTTTPARPGYADARAGCRCSTPILGLVRLGGVGIPRHAVSRHRADGVPLFF